jgi:hypothetical protein
MRRNGHRTGKEACFGSALLRRGRIVKPAGLPSTDGLKRNRVRAARENQPIPMSRGGAPRSRPAQGNPAGGFPLTLPSTYPRVSNRIMHAAKVTAPSSV